MKYQNIVKGTFLSRPSRFIAYAEMEGKEEKVQVNTGWKRREWKYWHMTVM